MTGTTDVSPDDFEWEEFDSSGRGHLIARDDAKRAVPTDDGSVSVKTMTLCGNEATDATRLFQGFDGHRNVEWCAMCKHLYLQKAGQGGLFGDG